MSCYEWERGSVKIPAAQWSTFKNALSSALATVLTKRYELALELFAHLKAAGKGKRNFNFEHEARNWADKQQPVQNSWSWNSSASQHDRAQAAHDVIYDVLPYVEGKKRRTPKMPKKKDFKAPRSTLKFSHPKLHWEASLVLDPKTRIAHWDVPENNRAKDEAWSHPMGVAFAQALGKVTWSRGSGGTFVGNDEYRRDDKFEGGGSNYVTRRFGPLGH